LWQLLLRLPVRSLPLQLPRPSVYLVRLLALRLRLVSLRLLLLLLALWSALRVLVLALAQYLLRRLVATLVVGL
jgi:hypothetical protein